MISPQNNNEEEYDGYPGQRRHRRITIKVMILFLLSCALMGVIVHIAWAFILVSLPLDIFIQVPPELDANIRKYSIGLFCFSTFLLFTPCCLTLTYI